MESGHEEVKKHIVWLPAMFVGSFFFMGVELHVDSDPPHTRKQIELDSALLETGDVVFRDKQGFVSMLAREASLNNKVYSHVGIAVRTQSEVMIYHASDDANRVIKETPDEYVNNAQKLGVYRYPLAKDIKVRLKSVLEYWISSKTPFDHKFNMMSDNELYCTELVYKSLFMSGFKFNVYFASIAGKKILPLDSLMKGDVVFSTALSEQ